VDNPRLPLFVAIGSAVLAVALVFFLVLPKMGQVSTAKEDLTAAKNNGQSLLTQKNALEDTKAEAPQNRAIIDHVQEQIPPTADEPGLLLLLDKAALDSGLDLPTFSPSPPVFDDTTGLSVISMAVSAVGTYNDVTQFTYKIETFPRAAKITSLTLTPGGTVDAFGDQILTVNISLEAYTSDTSAGPGSSPGPTEAGA
jgi:Tfp pilus assembly protein PilO